MKRGRRHPSSTGEFQERGAAETAVPVFGYKPPALALFFPLTPIPTSTPVKMKSELERLTEAVRKAEAELDAATTRSALNAAAKRPMTARAAR